MNRPYVVHDAAQGFQDGEHTHIVNTYTAGGGKWHCVRCQRLQAARKWRYFWHNAQRCTQGPDSRCYVGPLCAHCGEQPFGADEALR